MHPDLCTTQATITNTGGSNACCFSKTPLAFQKEMTASLRCRVSFTNLEACYYGLISHQLVCYMASYYLHQGGYRRHSEPRE